MDFKNINEGYPDGEEPLHFYYNREERLKNAPKMVQDYYAGKIFNNEVGIKGLFKSLVSTRTNRFLLISLIFFVACIYLYSFLQKNQNEVIFDIPCKIVSFSYDEKIYVSLKFEQKKYKKNEKQVLIQKDFKIKFYAYNAENTKCYESEEFFQEYTGNELFVRDNFPDYDIIKVEAEVFFDQKSDKISSSIKKRT